MERNRPPKKPRNAGAGEGDRFNPYLALKILGVIALIAVLVVSIDRMGKQTIVSIQEQPRYTIRILDIECPVPPGMDHERFLTEVRFISDLPETVQSVDPTTPERLKAAFAKHPWVRNVDGVELTPSGHLIAQLTFRQPSLVITCASAVPPEIRVLDSTGVLLPASTPTKGLPVLINPTNGSCNSGSKWPDENATRAAELTAYHKAERIERKGKEWILTQEGGKQVRISIP